MTDARTIQSTHTRRELIHYFVAMALSSFTLHAIWEMSQMPAFKEVAGRPFLETAARCTPTTLGDVLLTFWIYAIGALAGRNVAWGLQARWNVYLTVALLGAMHAIWIEQAAIASGRWSYTEKMPVFPKFGVGVWPLLQLTLLMPLTIWLSRRYALRKRKAPAISDSHSTSP